MAVIDQIYGLEYLSKYISQLLLGRNVDEKFGNKYTPIYRYSLLILKLVYYLFT